MNWPFQSSVHLFIVPIPEHCGIPKPIQPQHLTTEACAQPMDSRREGWLLHWAFANVAICLDICISREFECAISAAFMVAAWHLWCIWSVILSFSKAFLDTQKRHVKEQLLQLAISTNKFWPDDNSLWWSITLLRTRLWLALSNGARFGSIMEL